MELKYLLDDANLKLKDAAKVINDLGAEIYRLQEVLEFYAKIPGGDRAKAALAQRTWVQTLKCRGDINELSVPLQGLRLID